MYGQGIDYWDFHSRSSRIFTGFARVVARRGNCISIEYVVLLRREGLIQLWPTNSSMLVLSYSQMTYMVILVLRSAKVPDGNSHSLQKWVLRAG